MKTGRIALLHLETIPGAVEHNQQVIVEAIKQAASGGAQWIVTPELATCGLQFARVIGTDWIEPQPDAWMHRLCRLVKDLKRTLFLGCPERDSGRLYNSVFVINPSSNLFLPLANRFFVSSKRALCNFKSILFAIYV